MQLLDDRQIASKITRLAMEILERNTEESELYLIGINNRGSQLAELLIENLRTISDAPLHLLKLRISPASPLNPSPLLEGGAAEDLDGKAGTIG